MRWPSCETSVQENSLKGSTLRMEPRDLNYQYQIWQWNSGRVNQYQSDRNIVHLNSCLKIQYLHLNRPSYEGCDARPSQPYHTFRPTLSFWRPLCYEDLAVVSSDQLSVSRRMKHEEQWMWKPIGRELHKDACSTCWQISCLRKEEKAKQFIKQNTKPCSNRSVRFKQYNSINISACKAPGLYLHMCNTGQNVC